MYIESGFDNLKSTIYKRQLKFFLKVKQDCRDHPESPVSMVIQQALDQNVQFLRHYAKLERKTDTPQNCYDTFVGEHRLQIQTTVRQKFESDSGSILGTYCRVNPELCAPEFNNNIICNRRRNSKCSQK